MKNKFLEFLVNEKLKDITYNIREINTERDKRHSSSLEEYPYVDDFLALFKELNVSQEELFSALRESKASYTLAEMLVGYETQNDKYRNEKFEQFKPLLENNINFYREVIKVFLTDHKYIKEEFKERNKEIFIKIVDIGIKKEFFQHFSEEEKQTQTPEYKEILIEKNIFNKNYNSNLTVKILADKKESNISNHFSMYSSEIHEFLETLNFEKYVELKQELIKNHKIEENEDNRTGKLFNQIIKNLIEVEKDKFSNLLNNKIIRDNILYTDTYSNNAFSETIKSPELLKEFLSHLNDYEKSTIYNKEKYDQGILIKHLTETSRDTAYMDSQLLSIILADIEKYTKDLEDNNKDVVVAHILFNQSPKIKNPADTNKLFEKYMKNIVKGLTNTEGNENYFKYQDKLNKFNEFKSIIDSNIWNKIKNKMEVTQKDILYKFYQRDKTNGINYNEQRFLENLSIYISTTKDLSVLNVLNADPINPEWKSFKFSYTISQKTYSDETIISYLLRSLSKQEMKVDLIAWLAEESPKNFYDVKLGAKDIFSYFLKESENTKNVNSFNSLIIKIVDKLLEKESTFEAVLKNNKPKMKMVQTLNNDELKKKLNYHMLKQKLSDTKLEVQTTKVKNKI